MSRHRNKPATQPDRRPQTKPRPRHRRRLAVFALGLLASGSLAWFCWPRPVPGLPEVVLGPEADPAIRQAIEAARAEVVASPRSPRTWGRLGMVLQAHRFENEACTCYAEAAKQDPNEPRWHYYHALVLLKERTPSAVPLLRQTVALLPRDPAVRFRLAAALHQLGQMPEAEAECRKVLDLEPHHAWTQLLLGQVLTEQGMWQEGLTFLNQAVANRSTEKEARLARAGVLQRVQRVKEAEADLSALPGLGDDPSASDPFVEELQRQEVGMTARLNRALALGRRQGPRVVLSEMEQIALDYPRAEDAWRLLGQTQALAGGFRPAADSFRRAVQLKPDSEPAHFFLGVALLEIGERIEAMACFRRVMELSPGHGMSHYHLGLCLRQDHQWEAALEELRAAARYSPHSLQAQSALADLLLQTGRSNEAVEILQRALRLKPDDLNLKKLLQEAERKK